VKRYSVPETCEKATVVQAEEFQRLKAEIKRVTEERDILRKAAAYFAKTSG
jgi:transposase